VTVVVVHIAEVSIVFTCFTPKIPVQILIALTIIYYSAADLVLVFSLYDNFMTSALNIMLYLYNFILYCTGHFPDFLIP